MSAATDNLRNHQEQADNDGIMVTVSRQAIDETLTEYGSLVQTLREARAWIVSDMEEIGYGTDEASEHPAIVSIDAAIDMAEGRKA